MATRMTEQPDNKTPRIRLKGFSGKWDEKSIGKILSEAKRQIVLKDDERYELVTVKRRNGGVVSRGHLFGREILVKNYSQLLTGDFLISKRQVVHGATGIVPFELNKAIVSNEYLVAIGNNEIATEFLTLIASLPDMRKKFFLSSYGVDIEKLFFDVEDWKKRSITLPKHSEQVQIVRFFLELDQLIDLHQRKHEKLVTLKKSMLQKMFPSAKATSPEIRFKGFTKSWDALKLEEIGQPFAGLFGKNKNDFGQGQGRFITYMGVFGNPISNMSMTGLIGIDKNQNEVKKGDVLFTISSETPNEVGMSSVWSEDVKNVYLNSFCFGFRPLPSLNTNYLAYAFRSSVFREKVCRLGQGISRYNISKTKMLKLSINIPEPKEQQKIGGYFVTLDKLISRHAVQLQKLKQIKTACLEKMFV
jgi:type I restriction enzyme S subunit